MTPAHALVALDWGSTSVRAYRMAGSGEVLAERASDSGASRLAGGPAAFESALRELVGDWLAASPADAPVVACGMVGSAHGWKEAPYLRCPVALDALAAHVTTVCGTRGLRVHIVPGIRHDPAGGTADVMRGEETQIAGLLSLRPELAARACVLLPGTHSKWVDIAAGRIVALTTRMTGELYAVLRTHSVLGRLMEPAAVTDLPAFAAGLALARKAGGADLARHLFSVRTRGLTGELAAAALPDYLSGLLIGAELAAALRDVGSDVPLVLVGEPDLCSRYRLGLEAFGRAVAAVCDNASSRGMWQLAERAGWLPAR